MQNINGIFITATYTHIEKLLSKSTCIIGRKKKSAKSTIQTEGNKEVIKKYCKAQQSKGNRITRKSYSCIEFLGFFQMGSFQLGISFLVAYCSKVVPVSLSNVKQSNEMKMLY